MKKTQRIRTLGMGGVGLAAKAGVVWCVLVAAAARGQQFVLEAVDGGSEDVGPLSTSIREQGANLRVPVDFKQVYRIKGDMRLFGRSNDEEMYARVSNGLMAVFPRSSYVQTRRGTVATVPADTIWVLAGSTVSMGGEGAGRSGAGGAVKPFGGERLIRPVDGRIANEVSAQHISAKRITNEPAPISPNPDTLPPPPVPPPRIPPPPIPANGQSIWVSEGYRQMRVAARLEQAATRGKR